MGRFNPDGLVIDEYTRLARNTSTNGLYVWDFIFSVSRTIDDKTANSGRIFVAKNRNGPDGLVYPIFMDTSNVKIKVLPPTGETPSSIVADSAKQQAQTLKDKYKKYKKQKKENGA